MNTVDDRASFIKGAVDKICARLVDGGRGQLRTMPGADSVIARTSAQRLCAPGGTVILLTRTVDLVDEQLELWTEADVNHVALAVSPATTPASIVDWLRAPTSGDFHLIAGTHWSADLIGAALRRAGVIADVLIVDSAHEVAGLAPEGLRVVHSDDYLPAQRRLYVTDAPEVATGPGPDEREGFLDMNDSQVFGPVLFSTIEHGHFALPRTSIAEQAIGRRLRRNIGHTSRAMVRGGAERFCTPGDIVIVLSSTVALAAATILEWVGDARGHVALAVWNDDEEPDSWELLHKLHSTVTTDPHAIAEWVTRPRRADALRLIVAAHRSAHLMHDGLRMAGAVAELLVIEQADEFGTSPDEAATFLAGHAFVTARQRICLTSAPASLLPGHVADPGTPPA